MASAPEAGAALPASPRVRDAHSVAAREHAGQSRKATGNSYLRHVAAVAEVLAGAGFDDEVVAAALLHDVVEHTSLQPGEVRERFGPRVGAMVEAMTDREQIDDWEERKAEHRSRIAEAGRDAIAIYAADKLCGIREAREGYAEISEDVEQRLGTPLDVRLASWEADLEMLSSVEPPIPFAPRLAAELERLREDRRP
jgi:(p)ppGpp synthase/HD superfamily hydrolase